MGLTSLLLSSNTVFLAYSCLYQMPISEFITLHTIIWQLSFLFCYFFLPFHFLKVMFLPLTVNPSASLSSSMGDLMVTWEETWKETLSCR